MPDGVNDNFAPVSTHTDTRCPDPECKSWNTELIIGDPNTLRCYACGKVSEVETTPLEKHAQMVAIHKDEQEEPVAYISMGYDDVDNAQHYGGKDDVYEVGKVLEAWNLITNAYLWNVVKYVARHKDKDTPLKNLKKARFYLDCEIERLEGRSHWTSR